MAKKNKTSWTLSRRIEENYARQLKRVSERIIERLATAKTPDEIMRRLRAFQSDPEFIAYTESLAENMARQVYRETNRNWRSNAIKASKRRSRLIYEELQKDLIYSPLGSTINDIIYENAALIKSIPEKLGNEFASIMAKEAAYGGRRPEYLATEIKARFPELSKSRANLIARTEISKAQMALTQVRSQSLGINWYIWRTADDGSRVRPSHQMMEGVLVNWNNPPSPEALYGEKNPPAPYNAGNIYNCFPGSTEISLFNGCHNVWRRWYSGRIVEIVLSDGTRFETTPNHPILTVGGWIATDSIQYGDCLVYANTVDRGGDENNKSNLVATFDDVFATFQSLFGSEGTIGFELDFHGDGTHNEVDKVFTKPFLSGNNMPEGLKRICDFAFSEPDGTIIRNLIVCARNQILSPFATCSRYEVSPAFGIHSLHTEGIRLGTASALDIVAEQDFFYDTSATPIPSSQREFTFPSEVIVNDIRLRNVCTAIMSGRNSPFYNNPTSAEVLGNNIGMAINSTGSFNKCNAVQYKTLRVVNKIVRDFSGYVYNLQSNNGWYSITQRNIIVKNCRCFAEPVINIDWLDFPVKIFKGGTIQRISRKEFERIYG